MKLKSRSMVCTSLQLKKWEMMVARMNIMYLLFNLVLQTLQFQNIHEKKDRG